ncbi:hypothetical protein A8L34_27990 [Bacillus sp. FJAT-27264]|uniref:hypothetical protein n=1 Tax=Paenibacillus sp. (strain DSM 101736 / FJAT-27264) TaxID=1850362 RepID=UPI000807D61F|nr:hypothetical protein [Bacillus sp. FJAT-27264]OBZ15890.1 hypothetical protein A8L34_27990 [Bacillus sp. FJAT-27264]
MKITSYTWDQYISHKKMEKYKDKFSTLFKIRDAIIEANLNEREKMTITINKTKDYKEVLGIAGSLHFWWVIDFVIESNGTFILLYRNCKIHNKNTEPDKLWEDTLVQLETDLLNPIKYHD